jgi:hypothetical protein
MGKVLIYDSRDSTEHPFTMKYRAGAQLPAVLQQLGSKFSPVKRRLLFFSFSAHPTVDIGTNGHIFTKDDDSWVIQGRFEDILRHADPVVWKNEGNVPTLSLLVVSLDSIKSNFNDIYICVQPAMKAFSLSTPTTSSAPMTISTTTVSASTLQDQIATALGLSLSIRTRSKLLDLRLAYQKYVAYHKARSDIATQIADGIWPLGRMPTTEDLAEVFISKSVFFTKFKLFNDIEQHPDVLNWLESAEGCLTGQQLFGKPRHNFTFPDLSHYLAQMSSKKQKKRIHAESGEDESPKKKKAKHA